MSKFQTTRWSLIAAAAHGTPARARPALEQLCRAYRPPILAYIRRSGRAGDAEDLAQAFFLRFLERGWYTDADPDRGRFRSLLLASLRNFLADEHARGAAAKRGGDRVHIGDDGIGQAVDAGETPEQAFDRAWLGTVLARAMARLQREWMMAGKQSQFARLAPMLVEHPDRDAVREAAEASGQRGNTVSVQLHRMRKRLRQLVRLELMQTVGNREALEEELRHLRLVLGDGT